MNVYSEYTKLTINEIWALLDKAYKNEEKLDKMLIQIADEVFAKIEDALLLLAKNGKMILSEKIRLREHPELYKAIKELETQEWRAFTEWCWIGYQVITDSLIQTYQETLLWTYDTFRLAIPQAPTLSSPGVQVQITDTYITSHYLEVPWCQDGKTYSDRLWGNVANFQSKLSFILEEGINKGKGLEWMEEAWYKLTKTAGYEVARLLKTETMAMWAQATRDAYLEMGIEYVEIINPEACNEVCSEYVGEVIPLAGAKLGEELPPYHPNCVCDFVAYKELDS